MHKEFSPLNFLERERERERERGGKKPQFKIRTLDVYRQKCHSFPLSYANENVKESIKLQIESERYCGFY